MNVKHGVSIRFRVSIIFIITVFIMASMFIISLVASGLFKYINDVSYKTLYLPVANRASELEKKLSNIALNTNKTAEKIDYKIKDILSQQNLKTSQLDNKETINVVLESIYPDLEESLKNMNVSQIFLVLDKSSYNKESNRAGICIKDSEPNIVSDSNSDFILVRGPSVLSNKYKVPLGANWSDEYDFATEPSLDFYWNPYKQAQQRVDRISGSRNILGQWSSLYKVNEEDEEVVSYSLVLLDENSKPYAVFGISISNDYISKLIPVEEVNMRGAFYILSSFDTVEGSFNKNWYVKNGFLQDEDIKKIISIGDFKKVNEDKYNMFTLKSENLQDYYVIPQKIKLYSSNFSTTLDSWTLLGFAPTSEMNHILLKSIYAVIASILISVICGLLVVLIGSGYFARPISKLAKDVIKYKDKSQRLYLSKIGITEIDKLTSALEDISGEVYDLASRLTEIFNLVDEKIGCFEYNTTNNKTYLTDNIFNIMKIEHKSGDSYLSNEEWINILGENNFQYLMKNENIEIQWKDNALKNSTWLRVKSVWLHESLLGIITDITEEVLEREKLKYERDYDILTGLYNRRAFKKLVTEVIEDYPKQFGAMIFIDLDNLKYVNDSYGHEVGDKYIQCAARNFSKFSEFGGIVGRISGDEFVIYLHGFENKSSALEKIKEVFLLEGESLTLNDGSIQRVRSSKGISYYPIDASNCDDLIKYADYAMYEIKHSLRGEMKEFDYNSYAKKSFILTKKEALNEFIEKELIDFAFQPIVSTSSGEVYAYEALMRPTSKDFKTPYEVLVLGNEQSKLYHIERLTVLGVLKKVQDNWNAFRDAKCFLNSIPNQVLSEEDINYIRQNYTEYLPNVVVEKTEKHYAEAGRRDILIELVKSYKGEMALDDYGSGYNGQNILLDIKPDYIKIDMSFIRNIHKDNNRQQLVESILTYAKANEIKTIAEGVECYDEMVTLIHLGVDLLQGYYLGKPNKVILDIDEDKKKEIIGCRGL